MLGWRILSLSTCASAWCYDAVFSINSTYVWCYASGSFAQLAHTVDATLKELFFFCAHALWYAGKAFPAVAHAFWWYVENVIFAPRWAIDATVKDLRLHFHMRLMLRCKIFSRVCAPGWNLFLLHVRVRLMPRLISWTLMKICLRSLWDSGHGKRLRNAISKYLRLYKTRRLVICQQNAKKRISPSNKKCFPVGFLQISQHSTVTPCTMKFQETICFLVAWCEE